MGRKLILGAGPLLTLRNNLASSKLKLKCELEHFFLSGQLLSPGCLMIIIFESFPLGWLLGALKYINILDLKVIGWVEKSLRYAYVKFEWLLRQKENDQTH